MLNCARLMSDYEVTLVNDNSKHMLERLQYEVALTPSQCMSIVDALGLDITGDLWDSGSRQEFYVRFKGPEESMKHTLRDLWYILTQVCLD